MKSKRPVLKKTIFFILFTLADIILIIGMVSAFTSSLEDRDVTYAVREVEEGYYSADYPRMLDMLELYEFYSEDFDMYWEVGKAYICSRNYSMYTDSGDTSKAQQYYDELEQMYKNCEFDENKKIISGFLK